MAQAKTVTERELKWALLILREPRLSDRDSFALLVTHWEGDSIRNILSYSRCLARQKSRP